MKDENRLISQDKRTQRLFIVMGKVATDMRLRLMRISKLAEELYTHPERSKVIADKIYVESEALPAFDLHGEQEDLTRRTPGVHKPPPMNMNGTPRARVRKKDRTAR